MREEGVGEDEGGRGGGEEGLGVGVDQGGKMREGDREGR